MSVSKYLYSLNYKDTEKSLCALEIKSLFNIELTSKTFESDIQNEPCISPFLKYRLDVIHSASSFSEITMFLDENVLSFEDFKVEYMSIHDNDTYGRTQKKNFCKEIGLRINGFPSFDSPKITLGITFCNNRWYLGMLTENNRKWQDHIAKPHSYSSSIDINIAKALVNIAGNGDFTKRIIDPCCGVGTVLLEGIFAGYNIEGRDINATVASNARSNLSHFNYSANVTSGDIENITEFYDASIIDLPYGLFSPLTEGEQSKIIENAKRISKKVILVSSLDITSLINEKDLSVLDTCSVGKGRTGCDFTRHIYICEAV